MKNLKQRIEALESHVEEYGSNPFTIADWLSWEETGQPEPPAEWLERVKRVEAQTAETLAIFEGEN